MSNGCASVVFRLLSLLGLCSVLGACAVPLVIGANLAATEAFSEAVNPETQLDGARIFRLADWRSRQSRITYSITGKNEWTCANQVGGGFVCLPVADAIEANISQKVRFTCQQGLGGMMTQMIDSRNAATLFCKKA